ncbi:hypothetical protein MKW94_023256 [Papaver nudicaule]|uniref:Uncharacterized protein n=1 Tax=Papaver nudicaule TaxID=74823 RepID=A0AA41VAX5_PAPNU|nr:hypothetical protein [Papaver nudicaule]
MAKTQSSIIACVFICALVASNTLMCTAKVDLDCSGVSQKGSSMKWKAEIFGSCYTPEACDVACGGHKDQLGVTNGGKKGDCGPDVDVAGQPMACACCLMPIVD